MSASFWGRGCIEGHVYLICSAIFWWYLINWNRKKCWNQSALWVFICSRLQIDCETSHGGSVALLAVVSIDGVAPCELQCFLVQIWLEWFANAINLNLFPMCAVATARMMVLRKSWRQYLGTVGCCIHLQCKYSSKFAAFLQVRKPRHRKRSGVISRQPQIELWR